MSKAIRNITLIIVSGMVFLPLFFPSSATGETIRLSAFDVTFDGRTYNSVANTTTYSYTVTGVLQRPDLSHFNLEIPNCVPGLRVVSYNPTEAVEFGVDPTTRVDGIKWGQPLRTNSSRTYSLTISGNYKALPNTVAIKDGDGEHLAELPGPSCEPAGTSIDLQKMVRMEGMTGTWFDANDAPGLLVATNWPVYYQFAITNVGDSVLTDLVLTDDLINIESCQLPDSLATDATFECEVGPFTAITGQFSNVATITGVMNGETWTDTDTANYFGLPGPVLIHPVGDIDDSLGNPTYKWTTVLGASSYDMYLSRADNLSVPIFFGTFDAAQYCNSLTCEVDLTTLENGLFYWLGNGDYTVYLKANVGDWQGPFNFSLNVPAPGVVTLQPITNTTLSRPTLNWTLTGNGTRTSWFQVYVAPASNLANGLVYNWYSRRDVCEATTCSLPSPVDLINGSYVLYIRSWGAGGFSTGGFANSGWAGPENFDIAAPIVTDITGLTASVPLLSWIHEPSLTWYQVWIGSPGPDFNQAYLQWHLASELGCDVLCTLTIPDGIAPGTYAWYVQGWNAAGFTQNGWAEGPQFTISQ
ncbi:MAG: hypothetical protein OHK0046_50310 [Anaerolineae bacterium]